MGLPKSIANEHGIAMKSLLDDFYSRNDEIQVRTCYDFRHDDFKVKDGSANYKLIITQPVRIPQEIDRYSWMIIHNNKTVCSYWANNLKEVSQSLFRLHRDLGEYLTHTEEPVIVF